MSAMSSRRGGSGSGFGTGDGSDQDTQSSSLAAELRPLTQSNDDDDHHDDDRMPLRTTAAAKSPSRSNSGNVVAAKGAWKESMWGCFRYGCCHPSLCHACCCLPLAAAQVMTRLHLNGWGHPAAVTTLSSARTATSAVGLATKSVFATLLLLVASFWITRLFLLLIIAILDPNVDSPEWIQPGAGYYFFCAVDDLLALAYFLVSVFLVRNVRRAVRNKYSIPEGGSCPAGCEDTCCSMFCGACVASQLLRQTADYDSTPARCCTENGLPYSVGGGASLSPSNNNNSPSRPPTASSVVEMV